eukprot:scaffold270_cov347-Pavlova_lutheri.AAC.45
MHHTLPSRQRERRTPLAEEICVVGDGNVTTRFAIALFLPPGIHLESRRSRCGTRGLRAGTSVGGLSLSRIGGCDRCSGRRLFEESAVHRAADLLHAQAPAAGLLGTSSGGTGPGRRLFAQHQWFGSGASACRWLVRFGSGFRFLFDRGFHHGELLLLVELDPFRFLVVLDGVRHGTHGAPGFLGLFGQHGTVALGRSGGVLLGDFTSFAVAPSVLREVLGGSGVSAGRHEDGQLFFRPGVEVGGFDLRHVHA